MDIGEALLRCILLSASSCNRSAHHRHQRDVNIATRATQGNKRRLVSCCLNSIIHGDLLASTGRHWIILETSSAPTTGGSLCKSDVPPRNVLASTGRHWVILETGSSNLLPSIVCPHYGGFSLNIRGPTYTC